jgi:hypothetical protein
MAGVAAWVFSPLDPSHGASQVQKKLDPEGVVFLMIQLKT